MSRHADVGLVAPNAHLESLMRDLESKGRMDGDGGVQGLRGRVCGWGEVDGGGGSPGRVQERKYYVDMPRA